MIKVAFTIKGSGGVEVLDSGLIGVIIEEIRDGSSVVGEVGD